MSIADVCNRDVITADPGMSVLELARLMRRHHVGSVVVVDDRDGVAVPVGIVTDRDIVVEIVAQRLDQTQITVEDIMARDPVTASDGDGVLETIQLMRLKGVRRLPVVRANGALDGVLAMDDLLGLLAEELAALSKVARQQQGREAHCRR